MNVLDEQHLEVHVPVVGCLLIVLNSIVLLVALGMLVLTTNAVELVRDPEAKMILSLVGRILPALMGALTLPDFVAALGLFARKRWGRILGIVVGILNLPGVPMGTLVGGYTLFVLLQDSAKSYFDSPRPDLGAFPRSA